MAVLFPVHYLKLVRALTPKHSSNMAKNLRFIGKLDKIIKELDTLLSSIQDVYSTGAVEGYSEEMLFFKGD